MQAQSPVAVLVASDTGATGATGAATGTATTAGAGVATTGVVVSVLAAATSAMRGRMAPPFGGRAMAPSSARCWRAPAIAFGPRTASGKASFVLALRRRVCGRLVYARDCFVISSLFVIGLGTPTGG